MRALRFIISLPSRLVAWRQKQAERRLILSQMRRVTTLESMSYLRRRLAELDK